MELEQLLQERLDVVYDSMLAILKKEPMGYIYDQDVGLDCDGFVLLSTTCGQVDGCHQLSCGLDGGELVQFCPEWDELYGEYQKITLEGKPLNACLVFGNH